jgi:hypothetical protein
MSHSLGVHGCTGGFNVVVHMFVLSLSHLVYELHWRYFGGLEYLRNGKDHIMDIGTLQEKMVPFQQSSNRILLM